MIFLDFHKRSLLLIIRELQITLIFNDYPKYAIIAWVRVPVVFPVFKSTPWFERFFPMSNFFFASAKLQIKFETLLSLMLFNSNCRMTI